MNKPKNDEVKIFKMDLPPALLVFCLTLSGYVLGVLYDIAYLDYHQIGLEFVEITPAKITAAAAFGIIGALIWYLLFDLYQNGRKPYGKTEYKLRFSQESRDLMYICIPLIGSSLLISILEKNLRPLLFLTLISLLLILLWFAFFYVKKMKYKTWDKALKAHYKNLDDKSRRNKRIEIHDVEKIILLFGVIAILFSASIGGQSSAMPENKSKDELKTPFLEISENDKDGFSWKEYTALEIDGKEYIVIKKLSSSFIVKTYNPNSLTLSKSFRLVPLQEGKLYPKELKFYSEISALDKLFLEINAILVKFFQF